MRISSAYLVVRYVKVHFLKKSIPYISQVCTIMQIFTPGNTTNWLVRSIFYANAPKEGFMTTHKYKDLINL